MKCKISSGIWTRVAVSISFGDNRYSMNASLYILLRMANVFDKENFNFCRNDGPDLMFSLVSLFKGISTFLGYSMSKSFL